MKKKNTIIKDMLPKILLGVILLVVVGVGAWFISYYPAISSQTDTAKTDEKITTEELIFPELKGEAAIKDYAAKQFDTTADKLVVLSSQKQEWPSTCLGLNIDETACEQVTTPGYEMTFEIQGFTITYRGSEDGKSIRVVKK